MPNRPASCQSCGKRLSKKHWYYRNGQFFCGKRCWETASDKAVEEKAKAAGEKQAAEAKEKAAADAAKDTAAKSEQAAPAS